MSDLIRRQDALDAIDSWRREYPLDLQEPIDDCWNSIRELPAVQPDHTADIGKKVSISCGQENDLISRQTALDALARMMPRSYTPDGSHPADEEIFRAQEVFADCIEALEILPSAQPDKDVIDDCLYHIYKNISTHTATGGVIAIKYYMEKLYEEIYGEGKRPWWMT